MASLQINHLNLIEVCQQVLIWHVAPWGNVLDLASQKCMGTVPARVHVASKRATRGLAPLASPPLTRPLPTHLLPSPFLAHS